MRKLNHTGEVNPFLITTIVLAVSLIGSLVYAVMTQGKYTDARDNVDSKVAAAVSEAEAAQKTKLDAEFAEKEKNPLATYESPATLGSIKVAYPKTWSAYVEERDGQVQINGFFHPKFVPATDRKVKYALRVQLKNIKYTDELNSWADNVRRGDLKASTFTSVSGSGTRYDGKINADAQGSMIILPIRDKSLIIWTESQDYLADFDNIILKNFTFTP